MKLAVDFFPYFEMGAKLLDSDPSLYCISSWNDHGQARFVQNSTRLERSDFFPGLGWMLTNNIWQSLKYGTLASVPVGIHQCLHQGSVHLQASYGGVRLSSFQRV